MRIVSFILAGICCVVVFSCKKNSGPLILPSSVNVINAIPSSNPIIPVFGTKDAIQYFSTAQSISYQGFWHYSPPVGSNDLYVVQVADTTSVDLKAALFNGQLNLEEGTIYSLFLAGDTAKVDTMLVKDIVPTYADSSAGVRFINLIPGTPMISVNLTGSPSAIEFKDLGYKTLSSFRKYAADNSVGGSYTFDVRDESSGTLITQVQWSYIVFRNNTLVISGSNSTANGLNVQVFQTNNY